MVGANLQLGQIFCLAGSELDTAPSLLVETWLQVGGRKWRENDGSIIQHVSQSRHRHHSLKDSSGKVSNVLVRLPLGPAD